MEGLVLVLLGALFSSGSSQTVPGPMSGVEEDALLTTPGLIKKYGYPAEIHTVRTDDGYMLEMHRIPHGKGGVATPGKSVVFLQHGLLSCSACWVLMGPEKGLAYILADEGYDVWLGNSRGNSYSRRHEKFAPIGRDFWRFSWHEMGIYDIPAAIDYILNVTGQEKLFYAGHSQGTTQFYVMASERPEYNDKIKAMFSLSPIAFMNHLHNPFTQLLSTFNIPIEMMADFIGLYEFMPNTELKMLLGQAMCKSVAILEIMCENIIFLMAGYDSKQLNTSMIPVIMGHAPAGASTKQLVHYGQEVASGFFRQYDYHLFNLQHYGQLWPPKYNLSRITCPVALHYSLNDWECHPLDVDRLFKRLPNPIGKFLVPLKEFNHMDFLWAIDVKTLLYDQIISLMKKFDGPR